MDVLYGLTREQIERVARAIRAIEGQSPQRMPAPGESVQWVQIVKTQKVAGRYLGRWHRRNVKSRSWTPQASCWIDPPNDETLQANLKYLAKFAGNIDPPYGTLTVTATAGTFTITVDGETTDPIRWNAKASRVSVSSPGLIPTVTADGSGLTGGTSPAASWDAATQTLTITGSPTGGTFTITANGEETAPIDFDASAATVETELLALSIGTVDVSGSAGGPWVLDWSIPVDWDDATSTLSHSGTPTGGTFVLRVDGEATDPIDYDADGAAIQTALEALSNLVPGDVSVSGSAGGPWTLTFALSVEEALEALSTVDGATVTGPSPYGVTFTTLPDEVTVDGASLTGTVTWAWGPSAVFVTQYLSEHVGSDEDGEVGIATESGLVIETEAGEALVTESDE